MLIEQQRSGNRKRNKGRIQSEDGKIYKETFGKIVLTWLNLHLHSQNQRKQDGRKVIIQYMLQLYRGCNGMEWNG